MYYIIPYGALITPLSVILEENISGIEWNNTGTMEAQLVKDEARAVGWVKYIFNKISG